MASVVKIDEGKYRIYVSNGFRADGKPNRTSKTIEASSLRAAKKIAVELEREFQKKPAQINSKITFREFARVFDERHLSKLGPNSQDSDRRNMNNRLVSHFGSIRLTKLSTQLIADYFNELKVDRQRLDGVNKELSLGTIFNTYKLLRNMLNRAVDWGYISVNPCSTLSDEDRPKKIYAKPEIWQNREMKKFFDVLFSMKDNHTNTKHQLFCYLSLLDGCRRGEHIALTWGDVDFDAKCIRITKGVYEKDRLTRVKDTKTDASNRIIYIDDRVVELFKRHKRHQDRWLFEHQLTNQQGYVFLKAVTDRVEMPSLGSFNSWLRGFLKRNGIKHIGIHGFRRMAATQALTNNVPLDVVKNMLGHTDIATTNIYLRTLQDSQREGAAVVSNAYDKLINKEEK